MLKEHLRNIGFVGLFALLSVMASDSTSLALLPADPGVDRTVIAQAGEAAPDPGLPGAPETYDDIGPSDSLGPLEVEVAIIPSREAPVAGELWSVILEIQNKSDQPIWIIDSATVLTLAPEIFGQTGERQSLIAWFPSSRFRTGDEVIRVSGGSNYIISWKIDPLQYSLDAYKDDYEKSDDKKLGSFRGVFVRLAFTLKEFLFFNPGKFPIAATVHVWPVPPTFDSKGYVRNLGSSLTVTARRDILMEASTWVLIFGAAVGGVICFVLQLLVGLVAPVGRFQPTTQPTEGAKADLSGSDPGTTDRLAGTRRLVDSATRAVGGFVKVSPKTIAVGLASAVLLSGIATVLLSRLATTDFLLVVKVNDFWGAIATGFVIQWFGYRYLTRLIPTAKETK